MSSKRPLFHTYFPTYCHPLFKCFWVKQAASATKARMAACNNLLHKAVSAWTRKKNCSKKTVHYSPIQLSTYLFVRSNYHFPKLLHPIEVFYKIPENLVNEKANACGRQLGTYSENRAAGGPRSFQQHKKLKVKVALIRQLYLEVKAYLARLVPPWCDPSPSSSLLPSSPWSLLKVEDHFQADMSLNITRCCSMARIAAQVPT